jgi:hypothetical protein
MRLTAAPVQDDRMMNFTFRGAVCKMHGKFLRKLHDLSTQDLRGRRRD